MKKIDFIFDTDIGADCDDVMALAYLVYAKRNLGLDLKAVAISNGCTYGVGAIRAFFEDIGEPIPEIGSPAKPLKAYNGYCELLAKRFGSIKEPMDAPNSVEVMRRALVCSENAVICGVGAFTNVAALLESEPDEISPLSGVELVREKCSKIVLMAGIFEEGNERIEWNVHLDIEATRTVVQKCPVPLAFLPSETGIGMLSGKPAIEKYGDSTPLTASFLDRKSVRETLTRPSWDPATAVYAIEGCRDFLKESPKGTIFVAENGKTAFKEDENGLHSVILLNVDGQKTKADCELMGAEYIDKCALEVYGDR